MPIKRIGVISDTHGHLPKQVYEFFENVDLIIHAGDIGSEDVLDELETFKTTKAVYGNIDGFDLINRLNKLEVFEYAGLRFMLTHIGGYPKRYERGIEAEIQKHRPDIFIAGHSHILKVIYDDKHSLLHINPGASGRTGIHKVATLVRFEIEDKKPTNLEVLEFPKYG